MLRITDDISIADWELTEQFIRASGPGGQNVNKVATACQLRVDVFRLGLPPFAFRKLKTLAGSKMTSSGELVVTAREHRTREANRAEARARATCSAAARRAASAKSSPELA